jgi:anti-sigma B factor antagonist
MEAVTMTITNKKDGGKLTVALEGRLDTITAPQLEEELRASLDGVTELELDLAELAYISSAGLRVLLSAQKTMNKQGSMVVRNANSDIMDIFEATGFSDILSIE